MSRKAKLSIVPVEEHQDRIMSLSELCTEAAGHVAKARIALFIETADADIALAHLDEAIACLKRIVAAGKAKRLNGSGAALRLA